ncbi:MAG: cation transporter [Myxococcales bacterium]|jgi:cation diffusion facilitator family transporter|nr:cation transporter [Myxococcales bacterium]
MVDEAQRPRWVGFVLTLNVLLVAAHFVVFAVTGSRLVLAQGADSVMDITSTLVLALSARVGREPRDENHPFGHGRAEPIGALVAAVLAGVLSLEVGRSAVSAIASGEVAVLDTSVAAVLGVKTLVKIGFVAILTGRARRARSPALLAVVMDARNDVAATASSLVGYGVARAGWPRADAVLALPICVYIAYNGLRLARENLRFLMGEAPDPDVVAAIGAAAREVAGVRDVSAVVAHYVGSELHCEVTIVVAGDASATEGHDIGVEVQRAVEAHELVARAFVHVDTTDGQTH